MGRYVSFALNDAERCAHGHGEWSALDDAIVELDNRNSKALTTFTGGNNNRAELSQTWYPEQRTLTGKRSGEFDEETRKRHKQVGRSAQALEKKACAREMSAAEPLPITKSEKRKLAAQGKSEAKRIKIVKKRETNSKPGVRTVVHSSTSV